MTIAKRPKLDDVLFSKDLRRMTESINVNFRRLPEKLHAIDASLDAALTALAKRVTSLETAAPSTTTTTTATGTAGDGGGGSSLPVTEILSNTVSVTLSGATTTVSAVAPTNSLLIAIFLTITGMTGATSLDAGVAANPDQYGAGLTTSGNITDYTFLNPGYLRAVLDLLLTANGSNFTGGTAAATAYYWIRP